MGTVHSGYGQLNSVWLLHWREWERKGANVRGGGEGGRIACAEIDNHISSSGRASSWSWSPVSSAANPLCISDWDFTACWSAQKPAPTITSHHTLFSGARLFLAQLEETVLPVLLLFIPVSWIFNGKWRSARSRTVFSVSSQSKLYLSFASPRRQTGPTSSPSTTRKYPAPFGG